ncbi:MAG TPA: SURF1 family protein [Actinomycetota bacterium]
MDPSRRRRVVIVAIATIVAAVCIALGFWQLQRLADRRALNAEIRAARSAPPTTVRTADDFGALSAFRSVVVEGTYDIQGEVLLYGRSLGGEPGHFVVTPLALDDGSGVLVIRGWVPFSLDRAPVVEAAPAVRDVVVDGWLIAPESRGRGRPDRDGIVRTLDISGIGDRLPFDLAPFAVQLRAQDPPNTELPVPVPLPELSEGPHLSYAIQWFCFAAVAVAGAAILVRRERSPTAAL